MFFIQNEFYIDVNFYVITCVLTFSQLDYTNFKLQGLRQGWFPPSLPLLSCFILYTHSPGMFFDIQ